MILGDRVRKLFDTLRKRFSKRLLEYKKCDRSGTATEDIAKAKADYEKYTFFMWIVPHIKERSTKTNLMNESDQEDSPAPPFYIFDNEYDDENDIESGSREDLAENGDTDINGGNTGNCVIK